MPKDRGRDVTKEAEGDLEVPNHRVCVEGQGQEEQLGTHYRVCPTGGTPEGAPANPGPARSIYGEQAQPWAQKLRQGKEAAWLRPLTGAMALLQALPTIQPLCLAARDAAAQGHTGRAVGKATHSCQRTSRRQPAARKPNICATNAQRPAADRGAVMRKRTPSTVENWAPFTQTPMSASTTSICGKH